MKIIYLVVRTDHASVYYRTLQMVPRLAERGIEATVAILPRSFRQRLRLFRSLGAFDLVILQRKLFNWINFRSLRRNAKRLVYDLDDALFIKDSKSDSNRSMTRKIRFGRTARAADGILCGNDWIRDHAREFNSNTATAPTVVDLDRYPVRDHAHDRNGFTAVWIGSRSTLFYLERILPSLETLATELDDFKLRVISDRFPDSDTLEIERVSWSRATEAAALTECDVGLMPLFNDAWSRGKCGLKLLQYGAAGLPSVCSPQGVNQRIVENGKSGFHAHEASDWLEKLRILSQDNELRSAMGSRARRIVAEQFSLQSMFEPYLQHLHAMAGIAPPQATPIH